MKMNIQTLLPYVCATRRYGSTYVHSAVRKAVQGWQGLEGELNGEKVVATFCGWGRSLQTRNGHKYKAHLRYVSSGKPVPSKLIASVQA
jgi:hypothetical protein